MIECNVEYWSGVHGIRRIIGKDDRREWDEQELDTRGDKDEISNVKQ